MRNAASRLWLVGALLTGAGYSQDVVRVAATESPLSALQYVRAARCEGRLRGAVTLSFAPGRRFLAEPIVLTPSDSGIALVAERPGTVVFDYGRVLPKFTVGKDGVWRTAVPDGAPFEQLYVNGRRAVRAKSPNEGYFYMCCPVEPGEFPDLGDPATLGRRAFVADPEVAATLGRLTSEELGDVCLRIFQAWSGGNLRVTRAEAESGLVMTTGIMRWPHFFWKPNAPRYVLENFRTALDAPGEWFYDQGAKELLYMPLKDEIPESTEAVAPVSHRFVIVSGDRLKGAIVKDVLFDGIAFEHSSYILPSEGEAYNQCAVGLAAAVEIDGGENVTFRNCRFEHVGQYGVWFRDGCVHCGLYHSIVRDLGGGGVKIGVRDDVPGGNPQLTRFCTVDDSIVQHGGCIFPGAVGIWLGQCADCTVEHNDVGDFFYTGISSGFGWGYGKTEVRGQKINWNHVHHIGKGVLSDLAGIYTLRDHGGSEVIGNRIHDVWSYDYTGAGSHGTYTDEGSANLRFASNLVYRVKGCGHSQNFGKSNAFFNNIYIGSTAALSAGKDENHVGVICSNNIFACACPPLLDEGCAPALVTGRPRRPDSRSSVFGSNLYWDGGRVDARKFIGLDWKAWCGSGEDKDSVFGDPLFVNPVCGDFDLRPESPAFCIGFRAFSWREAGVRGATWRAEAEKGLWPDVVPAPLPPLWKRRHLVQDFESCSEGGTPPSDLTFGRHADNKGEGKIVTSRAARNGRLGLEVKDAKGLWRRFDPHFTVFCGASEGGLKVRFSFCGDGRTDLCVSGRDTRPKGRAAFVTGPSFRIAGDQVSACDGERTVSLGSIVPGIWQTVEMDVFFVKDGLAKWAIRLTPENGMPLVRSALACRDVGFAALVELVFTSDADEDSTYFLDDIEIKQMDPLARTSISRRES